jgi:pilus assembly protein CpaE
LRVLAAEAAIAEKLMIDAGAIDTLLYELRRKFSRVVVDLPRWASPMQRVVLGAAAVVVIVCERSLAGLRDTIRLQAMLREHAPQSRVLLIDGGASGERATVKRPEFEKAAGRALDLMLSHDAKAAGAAANAGQPVPLAAPRSPLAHELEQLIALIVGPVETGKRKLFGFGRR